MKNLGFAAVVAGGLTAAVLGLAGPAQAAIHTVPVASIVVPAGIDHQTWINDITPHVNVPQVDTSVHN
ncbi:hypothetical protein BH09ACT7_BH09ACT7_61120 [soil metagenome]